MVRTVRAIYEEGVFRPLESLEGLADRTTVRLRVETSPGDGARLSDFAGLWNAAEADAIAAVTEAEIDRIDPREW
jgi:predicted DNA-binding antitoxin AbrB/MazE fold protein